MKFKLNNILANLILGVAFFLTPFVVFAQSPNELFIWTVAGTNTISNDSFISVKAYDKDQSQIPYEIHLLDTECKIKLKTLKSDKLESTLREFTNVLIPFNEFDQISSGHYCLRTCVSMIENLSPASSCSDQRITIQKNIRQLTQNSGLPETVRLIAGQRWQYEVKSKVPVGLSLSYLSVPNFIAVDAQGNLSAVNPIGGSYPVIYELISAEGEKQIATFELQILDANLFASGGTEDGGDVETGIPDIILLSPTASTVYSEPGDNLIRFAVSDSDGVKSVSIIYSADGKFWKQVTQFSSEQIGVDVKLFEKEYDWNVAGIKNGEYWLKIIAVDNTGHVAEKLSPLFDITNSNDTSGDTPLIINVFPVDGSQIEDTTPTISGEFALPINSVINLDSFKILLNDTDISQYCVKTPKDFECNLTTVLNIGKHRIKANIADTSGNTAEKIWTFEVINQVSGPIDGKGGNDALSFNILGIMIPRGVVIICGIICLVLLLLFVFPWLLYVLWLKDRSKKETISEWKPTTPQPVVSVSPTPQYTYTYVQPQYAEPQVQPQPVAYQPAPIEPVVQPVITEPVPVAQPVVQPQPTPVAQPPVVTPIAPPPVVQSQPAQEKEALVQQPSWLQEKTQITDPNTLKPIGYAAKEE